ncbi:MAG: SDR family NAD(P)-dependent oxidoreductase [Pirellulaceae bacterium]
MLRSILESKSFRPEQTYFVTQGANTIGEGDGVRPAQGSLWGMVRTAMLEMPHRSLALIDLESGPPIEELVEDLLSEITLVLPPGEPKEDHVAYRARQRYVARLQAVPEQLQSASTKTSQQLPASDRFSLRVGVASSIDELHYVPIGQSPLGPHDVEIEVHSTGLNFSDVLKSLGLYPGIKDEIVPLGIECAGVVSRVGNAVDRFSVGQRVMGVAPYSFASHAATAQYAVVATPDNLTDDEAATIPITFLTAHYALRWLARLSANEKVLIHAGAGGVGLAAIQIAQSIGAEIFATAGSDEKRDFLRSLGVSHVMDSRSLDFADEILKITDGRGVDVVLNSLPGEAISKSLSILAAYGRFLEIGKTDIYQNRRIGLWPFQDNLSYHAIDLDRMLRQRPQEIVRLYDEMMPLFSDGVYRPLPLTAFPAESIVDAFRYMSKRRNIGKVVVSLNSRESKVDDHSTASPSHDANANPYRGGGTILITGGLGALGRQVAMSAIQQGATHLAILSRRSPDDCKDELKPLTATGASIAVLQGDVADRSSLEAALKNLPPSYPPIRGVFHAAGVLRDGLLQRMDLDQLRRAMAPKTHGAWNLHRSLSEPLDFFVMFSSIAGTIGSPGQANYAAGNAFLDGLASYRRRLGLPATSIAWGPWDSEGMAADPEIRRQLSERGMKPLAQEKGIDLLNKMLKLNASNLAIVDTDWNALISKLPNGGSSIYRAFQTKSAVDGKQQKSKRDEQLYQRLIALESEARLVELQSIMTSALSEVMGIDQSAIEVDQPLASLGMDSLMGMELQTKVESKLGVVIPLASLFDEPSVASLARVVNASYEQIDGSTLPQVASEMNESTGQPSVPAGKFSSELRSKSGLVALGGSGGEGTPLFCLHPIGGDLRCYDSLARAIKDRPVYGLRAQGLQMGSEAHQSMDAMVDDYLQIMRSAWPEGPFCLVGWSTGGIFAYEIARRLRSDRQTVQTLVLIDTPLPQVFETVDLADDARFLVDLIEFANYFASSSMEISYESLRGLPEDEAISSVLTLAMQHRVLPTKTTPEYLRRLVNVCKQHVRILQNYTAVPSDLSVDLLIPEESGLLAHVTGHTLDEDLGWSAVAPLRMHQVPGHHFTMMTAANARHLAEMLESLLKESTTDKDAAISASSADPTQTNY